MCEGCANPLLTTRPSIRTITLPPRPPRAGSTDKATPSRPPGSGLLSVITRRSPPTWIIPDLRTAAEGLPSRRPTSGRPRRGWRVTVRGACGGEDLPMRGPAIRPRRRRNGPPASQLAVSDTIPYCHRSGQIGYLPGSDPRPEARTTTGAAPPRPLIAASGRGCSRLWEVRFSPSPSISRTALLVEWTEQRVPGGARDEARAGDGGGTRARGVARGGSSPGGVAGGRGGEYAAGRGGGGLTQYARGAVALPRSSPRISTTPEFLREILDRSEAYLYMPTEPVPRCLPPKAPPREGSRERPASAQLTLFDPAPPPDTPLQVPLRETCGPKAAARLVLRTCSAQGVPLVVSDPDVLARLSTVLLR